jgi:selenocysteine-specific elongation factor
MAQKHFILATAGHVDHGKSALVKALTGIDPDRLPEEKARGITIDLGFAHLDLTTPAGESLRIGIVDVPGHEDFVRNMIAGIGAVDLALLVIAADDGWMPQTEEHLQILLYLDVRRVVIALTKIDVGNAQSVTEKIRAELQNTKFATAPIIATSVRTGEGLEKLKQTLATEFSQLDPPRDIGKPRLSIDRSFTLHGIGTVVTGTLIGGTFRRGEKVLIQPKKLVTRIRSIQNHGVECQNAEPGMRTALNLPDVLSEKNANAAGRGDIVTLAELGEPSRAFDVLLERSARNPEPKNAKPLRDRASVYVHIGTVRVFARVIFLEVDQLGLGRNAIAQLRLKAPMHAFAGDRFVLRDASERQTIAGGVILDPDSNEKDFHSDSRRRFLTARAKSFGDLTTMVLTDIRRSGALDRNAILRQSNFSSEEIARALNDLQHTGHAIVRGPIAADVEFWRSLCDSAAAKIDAQHRDHPERPGLDLAQLRSRNMSIQVSDELIAELCRNGFARSGTIIRRTSHRPMLPKELQAAAAKIREALAARPFDPPSPKTFVSDPQLEQALKFLIEQNEVIELAGDLVLSRAAFVNMKKDIADFISNNGAATVSQLRSALKSSRRVMVPLLERLDREGFTRRVGDQRILAQQIPEAKLSDAPIVRPS